MSKKQKKNNSFFMDELFVATVLNENELIESIKDFSKSDKDKKERGVVFTNEKTILDLLKLIPGDSWKNKKLKWFDPGSGIGNIMIYVFFKLMEHIPIKNEEKRRKHILENMIYFAEIKEEYIQIIKHIFCSNKYKLNIHEGSFVKMNIEKDNINIYSDTTLFDIIVTNPPYQKPNKGGGASAKPLYHLFIQKSLTLLKDNGYLVAIHPFTWRRKSKEIKLIDELLKYQILYLYTNNNFKEFKKSAIHINYYLLKKCKMYQQTICDNYFNHKYYQSSLYLNNNLEFLPILLTEEVLSILTKMRDTSKDKLKIILESKLSSTHSPINTCYEQNETFKYKNCHTYSLTKEKYIYKYSKEKHPSHDKHKIVMNFKGGYNIFRPFIDKGTMGITDHALYIETTSEKNESELINLFKSDLFKFILMITSYNYAPNKKNEFHILNTLSISNNYHLTEKEKELIDIIVNQYQIL